MPIGLTEQQQDALDSLGETPPRIIDPRTSAAYVLVPAAEYEAVREALEDERRQRDIHKIALHNTVGRIERPTD